MGFPPKTIGKNKKVFSTKPKQISAKLHGNKQKTVLASWKRRKLVDEKENYEQEKSTI